jgi:hypothetical protein
MVLWVFFFPWTRETGEEEDFFFPCHRHLPLQKDADSPLKRPRHKRGLESIGGLESIKQALYELVILPLRNPDPFSHEKLLGP